MLIPIGLYCIQKALKSYFNIYCEYFRPQDRIKHYNAPLCNSKDFDYQVMINIRVLNVCQTVSTLLLAIDEDQINWSVKYWEGLMKKAL